MKTSEVRSAFLDYFISKGHQKVDSSSLIPAGDPTLLFVNAGMVQFKDCFLGIDKRAYSCATTSQKCLRISGKHNDLENVGRTARHHTFFEMLGNFSFGDYFKKDAIKFAWEFLTDVLALPKERLWITIFEDDSEAEELWKQHTDVMEGRILRCGAKDNFWSMGNTGPCGPCTEIHYFLGDDVSTQSEKWFRKEDGTFIEIWNLVFMQFNRDIQGNLNLLPRPSVDTGMGLERIAAVKQGVKSNYDIDLMRQIIACTEDLSGQKYEGRDYTERDTVVDEQYGVDVAHRVVCDHVRSCAFLLADGVLPSSDGRGYVLRRLIRRACRHGRVLGFNEAFLFKVVERVIEAMGGVYPELTRESSTIVRVLRAEEEKFIETLDAGLKVLEKDVALLRESNSRIFPGRTAFTLHDTYGFPLDLTEDIVASRGFAVDVSAFQEAMEEQRERSRSARASESNLVLQRSVSVLPTEFVGYEFIEYESEVLGLFSVDGEMDSASVGQEVAVVVSQTPFYAESGGQVGDTGSISTNTAALEVFDIQKAAGDTIVHLCRVNEGELRKGERVRLAVDERQRKKIAAHHSATHLLHFALREVLGNHVKQAGSRVSSQSLRFDFNHTSSVTTEELEEIESIVNDCVRDNGAVSIDYCSLDEAQENGAMALFDEKYGDVVRVVRIGELSTELCGGTHVNRSGDIGYVSIQSESSIAAGVRRIEAVAGETGARDLVASKRVLRTLGDLLNLPELQLVERVQKLIESNRNFEREVENLCGQLHRRCASDLTSEVVTLADGTQVLASVLDNASPKQLREAADDLRSRMKKACIALGSVSDGKAILLTAVSSDLTDKYHAGKLIKKLSEIVGGRGGGKADLAQAGGGDPAKLSLALQRFQEFIG